MFSFFRKKPSSAEERRIQAWCRKTFGINPRDLPLYRQALRHSSSVTDDRPDLPDNERLEFLGDAVLDTIVGQFVYRTYPEHGEGFLTRMRSKLVSRHQLSILAKRVEVERVMESNLGRNQDTAVPGNAMEALFGALLLDKGFDRTNAIVLRLITQHFDIKAVELEDRDSKSRLLEWGQKQHRKVEFIIHEEKERGGRGNKFAAEVMVEGRRCGAGQGHSKKKAEQEAARDAMRGLGLQDQMAEVPRSENKPHARKEHSGKRGERFRRQTARPGAASRAEGEDTAA